ncbi:hypothetical protein LINPERPRIM_LOCUS44033 [Linum perenne]
MSTRVVPSMEITLGVIPAGTSNESLTVIRGVYFISLKILMSVSGIRRTYDQGIHMVVPSMEITLGVIPAGTSNESLTVIRGVYFTFTSKCLCLCEAIDETYDQGIHMSSACNIVLHCILMKLLYYDDTTVHGMSPDETVLNYSYSYIYVELTLLTSSPPSTIHPACIFNTSDIVSTINDSPSLHRHRRIDRSHHSSSGELENQGLLLSGLFEALFSSIDLIATSEAKKKPPTAAKSKATTKPKAAATPASRSTPVRSAFEE